MNFFRARMLQPLFKAREDDRFFIQPRADDKREAEFFLIRGIVFLEPRDFVRRQFIQARACLFAGGFAGKRAREREFAHEVRMGADKGELFFFARIFHRRAERCVEKFEVGERFLRPRRGGNPRGMFKHRADDADEIREREPVDFRQRKFAVHAPRLNKGVAFAIAVLPTTSRHRQVAFLASTFLTPSSTAAACVMAVAPLVFAPSCSNSLTRLVAEQNTDLNQIAFRCGNVHSFVEVTANPWTD